jgi:hypothetical protein
MRLSWKVYILAGVVLAISYLGASVLPTTEILRGVIALPGVGALLVVLYQLLRDHAAFERELELKRRDHLFTLSVTSHMAELAFDKSVAFSEEYLRAVYGGLLTLFATGPGDEASRLAGELQLIRRKHAPWVTAEVAKKLESFEKALSTMAANAALLKSGVLTDENHPKILEMYNLLHSVLGMKGQGRDVDPALAPDVLIEHLQDVLGIRELTALRQHIVTSATSGLRESGT